MVGKRLLDVILATITLVILGPLLLLIAILIKAEDGGQVIFRQRRVGRSQRPFVLLKFRSMRENVGDLPSNAATGLPITRIGRVLRRTNLDEVPQLINIMRGDMSIVGPRPALSSQDELISRRSASGADQVRPGLTGLAQVTSYDGMSVEEKAIRDAQYVSSISFVTDISIIWRTLSYLRRTPPVY